VIPKGDRIQLDFSYRGKRRRPTIDLPPTQANLKHARRQIEAIKGRIRNGTFSFAEEFPEYRFIGDVAAAKLQPTFDQVADQFLVSIGDLEFATQESYRKILSSFWRSKIGSRAIADIRYGELAAIVGERPWSSNKTRNNIVSVARRVFQFAHADETIERDPTERLKSLRVQRTPPEPYSVDEVTALVAGLLKHWGGHAANYVEFGFFSGCRPSELIALLWEDVDLIGGTVRIDKARVMAKDKDRTKTAVAREIELGPRALDILRRQRELTGLKGGHVFTRDDGEPFNDLQIPWKHWRYTHKRLGLRYREPYQMRHTSVTWNLMIGKNLLWVAEQHGHSAAVMLKVYAKWMKGATEKDVEAIRVAMGFVTNLALAQRAKESISLNPFGNVLAEREGFEPSIRG